MRAVPWLAERAVGRKFFASDCLAPCIVVSLRLCIMYCMPCCICRLSTERVWTRCLAARGFLTTTAPFFPSELGHVVGLTWATQREQTMTSRIASASSGGRQSPVVSLPNSRRASAAAPPAASTPATPSTPAPTPAASSTAANDTATTDSLLSLLGAQLRVTVALSGPTQQAPTIYEGSLWCYDPVTACVVLECQPSAASSSSSTGQTAFAPGAAPKRLGTKMDYPIFKASQVRQIEVLSATPTAPLTEPASVSLAAVQANLDAAIKAEEAKLARRGPKGVTRFAQEVFDALYKSKLRVASSYL